MDIYSSLIISNFRINIHTFLQVQLMITFVHFSSNIYISQSICTVFFVVVCIICYKNCNSALKLPVDWCEPLTFRSCLAKPCYLCAFVLLLIEPRLEVCICDAEADALTMSHCCLYLFIYKNSMSIKIIIFSNLFFTYQWPNYMYMITTLLSLILYIHHPCLYTTRAGMLHARGYIYVQIVHVEHREWGMTITCILHNMHITFMYSWHVRSSNTAQHIVSHL